jgi:ElaB/YqjD/DUF883 family membrane-anchored ribosome-binding protein
MTMDNRRSEDLKTQMAKTRSKLADKLEILEEKLIEPAATAVSETATTVKEAVGNTAEAVQTTMRSVAETFDLATHVRKHPWPMMGAGFATGILLSQFMKAALPAAPLATKQFFATSELSSPPANGPDLQRNRMNGVYATKHRAFESPKADGRERTGESWSKLATEMQSTVLHALTPVFQGLIGAVLAEFLRPRASSEAMAFPSKQHEGTHEEWPHSDIKQEPDWSGRLRSTPR